MCFLTGIFHPHNSKIHLFLCTEYRLVCKIHNKSPNQNLNITLEVHEGEVVGRYSIEGEAQKSGFSFVVRIKNVLMLWCIDTFFICGLFMELMLCFTSVQSGAQYNRNQTWLWTNVWWNRGDTDRQVPSLWDEERSLLWEQQVWHWKVRPFTDIPFNLMPLLLYTGILLGLLWWCFA